MTQTPEEIERGLVELFKEVLEADRVEPTDNFFELGGDSLLATGLIVAIERHFNIVFPRSVLLEAPTPRKLADAVALARNKAQPVSLVPVQADGIGAPVFCVHGMPGDTIFARKLAKALKSPRPIFGLRAVGLRSGEVVIPSVGEIVRGYLAEIRAKWPTGPYLLVGQCGTAVIALDLALRLSAQSDEVPGLVLIDPAIAKHNAPWLMNAGSALMEQWTAALRNAQSAHEKMKVDGAMSGDDRRRLVSGGLRNAVAAYVPKPYAVPPTAATYFSTPPEATRASFPISRRYRSVDATATFLSSISPSWQQPSIPSLTG